MGCIEAKAINVKRIELVTPGTGYPNIDAILKDIAQPLDEISRIKNQIKDAEIHLKSKTFLYLLIRGNITDAIRVILYRLSASLHNDFSRLKLSFLNVPPYIILDKTNLLSEVIEPVEALEMLIKCYVNSYAVVLDISERLTAISNDLDSRIKAIKMICVGSEMNIVDTAKVVRTVNENSDAVKNGLRSTRLINEHIENMKRILERLNESFDKAEVKKIIALGKKISNDTDTSLRNIILKYWPEKERVNVKYDGVDEAINGFGEDLI